MLKSVLSSVAIAACLPVVIASQESIALDLQIYLNGTLVGSPTLRFAEDETEIVNLPDVLADVLEILTPIWRDETGSVRPLDLLDVAVMPTRQGGGRIRVALEFATGTARPVMVIDEEHPGVVKIMSTAGDEDEAELRFSVSSH